MDVKEILKNNKHTYALIKKIRKVQFEYLPYLKNLGAFNVKRALRVSRINQNSKYEPLKDIKNKHLGKRCFLIATGPSLTIEDLEKLTGELTISMNSICLAFDQTDWRPTYYGIQDIGVYSRMKEAIEKLDAEGIFISDHVLDYYKFDVSENNYIFPINFLHHYLPSNTDYHTKFSNNAFSAIYNGHTITYSLLQIAVYMGFKEIYLLGADCTYGNDMKHHFIDYDLVDPTYALAQEMMTTAYQAAKQYADKNNIKIYNATRGGALEVFERVDLDQILSEQEVSGVATP